MRILTISNLYPPVALGGYEQNCAEVTEHLRSRHEVVVITSCLGRERVAAQAGVHRLLPHVPESTRGALRAPAGAVRAARITRGALRRVRPDLVCVWNGSEIPHAGLRVVADSGVPVLFHVYEHWFGRLYAGDPYLRFLQPGQRGAAGAWSALARAVNRHPALRLESFAPARAAVAWASDALRRQHRAPPQTRVVLERTLYPVHAQTERFGRLPRAPLNRPTILFVGRLSTQKGPDIAYRALARLRSEHGLDARLVAAGPWERRARKRLDEIARELGIAEHIDLRGMLDEHELGALLRGAHALVVPSRWEEPLGLVCLEGAYARVPVVAARSGGMPELLHEDEHALFFDKEDVDGCTAALARTLSDRPAAEARAIRAFERARTFTFAGYIAESERLVEDTVSAFAERAPSFTPRR